MILCPQAKLPAGADRIFESHRYFPTIYYTDRLQWMPAASSPESAFFAFGQHHEPQAVLPVSPVLFRLGNQRIQAAFLAAPLQIAAGQEGKEACARLCNAAIEALQADTLLLFAWSARPFEKPGWTSITTLCLGELEGSGWLEQSGDVRRCTKTEPLYTLYSAFAREQNCFFLPDFQSFQARLAAFKAAAGTIYGLYEDQKLCAFAMARTKGSKVLIDCLVYSSERQALALLSWFGSLWHTVQVFFQKNSRTAHLAPWTRLSPEAELYGWCRRGLLGRLYSRTFENSQEFFAWLPEGLWEQI